MATIEEIEVLGRSDRPGIAEGLRIAFRGVAYFYEPWKTLYLGGIPADESGGSYEAIRAGHRKAVRTHFADDVPNEGRPLRPDEAELYDLAFEGAPPPLARMEWLSRGPGADDFAVIPGDRAALDVLRRSRMSGGPARG